MSELITNYGYESFIWMTMFAVLSCLLFLISLILCWISNKNSLEERKRLSFINGYAASMVQTYYYEHLKKIIDNLDPGGIYHEIEVYKEKEDLDDFRLHKIFIIICASGFVTATLEDIDRTHITHRKKLILNCVSLLPQQTDESTSAPANSLAPTSILIDEGYTIPVYKVKSPNTNDHVSIAVGPPLFTLHDASKEDIDIGNYKKQIIDMFSKKLSKKLAANEPTAKSFEIIFYNDDHKMPATLAKDIIERHIELGLLNLEALHYPSSTDSLTETSKLQLGS